jgi:AbrB family looped-hinge helix DNA binding protein
MTTRIGAKGQVVIPKSVRDQAQLHPGDEVDIAFDEDRIVIVARRHAGVLGGRFAQSGMADRLLEDRRREPR